MKLSVYNFYRFVPLPDYRELQAPFLDTCNALGLKGSILLAEEGINASLSAEKPVLERFMAWLAKDARFAELEVKENDAPAHPFKRMLVKLRREIVTMGSALPAHTPRGEYLEAEAWNAMLRQPDVAVIDTRNDYEVRLGSFVGAIDPQTTAFGEFPEWAAANLDKTKHKKIAMFCTGGIRCEKSTAYLKAQGFDEVYHLKGGILQYLADTKNESGLWNGECYVFDERVAVDAALNPTGAKHCTLCGGAISGTEPKETLCVKCRG